MRFAAQCRGLPVGTVKNQCDAEIAASLLCCQCHHFDNVHGDALPTPKMNRLSSASNFDDLLELP